MNKNLLVEYLDVRRLPLSLHVGAAELHNALCEAAPKFYLTLMADPATDVSHKREMLINILSSAGIERQSILQILFTLPPGEALQIIEVIRDLRINRSRARELVLAFLLGHEQFALLAATKRQRVVRLLKHALGERTWSSVRRFLEQSTPEGEALLQHELLHYAHNGDTAHTREVLCFLASVPFSPTDPLLAKSIAARQNLELGEGLPLETLLGLRSIYHKRVPIKRIRQLAASERKSRQKDGPLTALYKELLPKLKELPALTTTPSASTIEETVAKEGPFAEPYGTIKAFFEQNGPRVEYNRDLLDRMVQAVGLIPQMERRLAILLDLSSSMVSSGERLYHPAALAMALTRLLQERVYGVLLYQVGGFALPDDDAFLLPQGATDLASALIEAARQQPEIILIITDGYENIRPGDTAQVVHGLRQLGLTLPIYQVVPLFTAAENLAQRKLGENIPVIPISHENGVRELLAYTLLASSEEQLSSDKLKVLQNILSVR